MGQDPSKRRTLKPEVIPTIFQHVPQPKALTPHKHSLKRTVKLERKAVSKSLNLLASMTKIVYIYDQAFKVGVVGDLVSTTDVGL